MSWNNFENDKAAINCIYAEPLWDKASGLSEKELLEGCLKIEKETEASPRILTKSQMYKFVLENAMLDVRGEDFFPERLCHDTIIYRIRDRWIRALRKYVLTDVLKKHEDEQKGLCYTGNLDLGHCAPDWDALLKLGVAGLLQRVKEAKAEKDCTEDQAMFYDCTITVLEATISFILRLSEKALECKSEKSELVSSSLANLANSAPENTLEAMQLIMIFYNLLTNVEGEAIRSLGGLDRLLYPFYNKDVESGKFTDAQIRELFRYFFWKFYCMKVTANVPFYLGGEGKINKLSYIIVEEYSSLNINDPKIHIRYYDGIPQEFVSLVCKSIRDGRNSFVFINDAVVEKALTDIGEAPEDAKNYIPIGCYEPCALGKEIPCTCAGRVNMVKALLTVMCGGVDRYTGKTVGRTSQNPDSYKTFDEFLAAVKEQIAAFFDGAAELIRAYEEYYPVVSQAPLLSSTFEDCIEKGVDAYAGGAKYNNSSIVAFSVATTADALVAVKRLVYEEKRFSLSDFAEILKNNWSGEEMLHLEVLKKLPKYGNGKKETDSLAKELVAFAAEYINGKANNRGGVFRLGLFSIDYRITFGERTGATPDGRIDGEMLSKNMGAVTAMDKEGVTALINSVTAIDYSGVPDGTVLDVMLHTSATEGEGGLLAMYALLKTYMDRGGFAMQINVLSPSVLYAAQREPEKYSTLQVRLCGWNVYFTELSREEQNEFIRQCENAGN